MCALGSRAQGSAGKRRIAFDESMHACGSDATGSLSNLNQYQLAFVYESIDRGPGYPEFGFGCMYTVKKRFVGWLRDFVSA